MIGKLEELRSRGRAEDAAPAPALAAGKRAREQPARAQPKGAGTSRIREMTAAARKAKRQQGDAGGSSGDSSFSPPPAAASASGPAPAQGEKTFEAGPFCVRSPVRSPSSPARPSPATPAGRSTLFKAVLSSEAKKASNSKIQNRLQSNIKNRKSTRLSAFDNARNLERCPSPAPAPVSEAQLNMEHRRQQLQKWKLEKEKKKKEEAAKKKKSFLAGLPRKPLNFMPPPSPPPKPSTSGRVTCSQTRNTTKTNQKTKSPVKAAAKGRNTQSFAPKNASFKPPEIKDLAKLPNLAPVSKSKPRKTTMVTFDPVVPKATVTAKQRRSRPALIRQNAIETMLNSQQKLETRTTIRGKVTKKPSPKRVAKKPLASSSSGNDIEPAKIIHRVQTSGPMKSLTEAKELTPKILLMESTSIEQSSSDSEKTTSRKKSAKKAEGHSVINVNNNKRKLMPKNSNLSTLTSDTSAEKITSDATSDQEMSPVVVLKKCLPCTPRNKTVPKSESSSEEKLRSPKSPIEVPLTPEQMESAKSSPCITFSRGKDNKRKEMKWKIDEGLPDDDVSDMDSVDHFHKQLSSVVKRMTELCKTWAKVSSQIIHRVQTPGPMKSLTESLTEHSVINVNNTNRKSMPKNSNLSTLTSDTSAEKITSDATSDQEMSPVVVLKRCLPCTPRNKAVPKSESSSEEKLRSPKSPIEVPLTPEQMESAKISLCVTFSRGKDNKRKEMKWKIDEGLPDDDVSDMDSVDHFRKQLSSVVKRLTELCETWDKVSSQHVLPEMVQEAILSAVGQARLLMSQKLQQFASLVECCAKPETGTALVTPADLHGFWDMVFMQVENVDLRFKKLEELRSRGWSEDAAPAPALAAGKRARGQLARAQPKGAGTSRIREMTAAARKAKRQQGDAGGSSGDSSLSPPPAAASASGPAPAQGEKTFEAGFFCVRSPVRSPSSPARPSPATPAGRSTLFKAVLSSEAKKASNSKKSSPFAMLHASLIGKSVEYEGFAPLPKSSPFAMLHASLIGKSVEYEGFAPLPQTPQMTPLSLNATPGCNTLKKKKAGKKSINVVLFDDSDDSNPQYQSCMRDSNQSTISGAEAAVDKENFPIIEVTRTRSQRKSLQNLTNIQDTTVTEVRTPRRSSRKKNGEVKEAEKKTPNKQSGRKKATKDTDLSVEIVDTRKRSSRNKSLKELDISALEDVTHAQEVVQTK